MNINKINSVNRIGAAYQAYQKNNEPAKKDEATKKNQYDQLELSSEAQKQIHQEKEEKIAKLTSQIANGTYMVDSEKVAEKLLAFWKSGAKIDE